MNNVRPDQVIDALQTIVVTGNVVVLVYIVMRLEKAFNNAADKLRKVINHEQAMLDSLNNVWSRIAEIENRTSLAGLAKRLDELEKSK